MCNYASSARGSMLSSCVELCFHAIGKGADMVGGNIPHVAFEGL